jgi:hypothetical protein
MTIEKIQSVERVADWTYIPPLKYRGRIAVFEFETSKKWELIDGNISYKGNFEEILRQCIEIVAGSPFTKLKRYIRLFKIFLLPGREVTIC